MTKIRLGTLRSGRLYELPYELVEADVQGYLVQFNDLELVDILCLSELNLLINEQEHKEGSIYESLQLVGSALLKKRQDPLFSKLLDEQGLHNAAAFIRHAKSLTK